MTPENAKQPDPQPLDKKPRHRSPNYPALGLRAAVDKINAVYAQDGLATSLKIAALKHMGYEKAHGEAARTLSALKSFGLIEEIGDRIKLTQRGIDIVAREEGDSQRSTALWTAAISPDIYQDLLKQYRESGLPSDIALKSELIAVKRFNPNAVQEFIRDFRDTLEFAGISDVRVIDWNLENEEMTPEAENKLQKAPSPTAPAPPRQSTPLQPSVATLAKKAADQILHSRSYQDVFSLTEGPVTIQWPATLSAESFEDLRDWLDIVKRKIGRSVTSRPVNFGDMSTYTDKE
ncbi:MAG: hypothetical protein ABSH49_31340 [Bryobacteraceae bacterium]|jgi:hypothetical protein